MGSMFSRLYHLVGIKSMNKILILGLDGAGKTTILYKLLADRNVVCKPTINANIEQFEHKSTTFLMWDVGGPDNLRDQWSAYYKGTRAVILVLDSTDVTRLPIIKEKMHKVMKHKELKNSVLLIYANKQDQHNSLSPLKMSRILDAKGMSDRSWQIQGCSAINGEGLFEGLEWLVNQLS